MLSNGFVTMLHDAVAVGAEKITALPTKAAEIAGNVASVVSAFDPLTWIYGLLGDWKESVLLWASTAGQAGLYGVLACVALRVARFIYGHIRQDATWLRWTLAGDVQQIAFGLRAQGRQVRHVGGNVMLVNAWDSGNVARALQAHGVRYEAMP